MKIDFILSQTDPRPMYLQILEHVQRRIAVGDWQPGAKMPSIREAAVALKVSIITVKRAYLELERSGVIVTQQGKGSWIAEGLNRSQLQLEELDRHLQRVTALGRNMGITLEELMERLEKASDQTQESTK